MVERVSRSIRRAVGEELFRPGVGVHEPVHEPGDLAFLQGLQMMVDAYLAANPHRKGQPPEGAGQELEDLMLPETFGPRLAHYRTLAGMTQTGLAKLIGMQPANLSRIERGGKRPPGLDRVLKIAHELNLPPKHALGLVQLAGYPPELLLSVIGGRSGA